jgi:hypothetical protein
MAAVGRGPLDRVLRDAVVAARLFHVIKPRELVIEGLAISRDAAPQHGRVRREDARHR